MIRMKTNINIFKRFSSILYSDIQNSDKKMEDLIKDIFYSSVNSVKPCELITKNKLITICSENNREFIEIKNKNSLSRFDITGKRIHLGEQIQGRCCQNTINYRILQLLENIRYLDFILYSKLNKTEINVKLFSYFSWIW